MIKHSGAIVANTLSVVCALFFILPGVAAAGEFVPLVGIPGIGEGEMDEGFGVYINALYILAISIAGLLAVIKLIIAGTKYMLSDIVTQKQDAKSDIKGALLGLLIVLGAVVILTTINEDLLNTDVGVGVLPNLDGRDLVVAEFISRAQACDAAEDCEIVSCPFLRNGTFTGEGNIFSSCEEWCAAQGTGSEYIRNGILNNQVGLSDQVTDQCQISAVRPTDSVEDPLRCDPLVGDDGGSLGFSCTDAEAHCENTLGGIPQRINAESAIRCVI